MIEGFLESGDSFTNSILRIGSRADVDGTARFAGPSAMPNLGGRRNGCR